MAGRQAGMRQERQAVKHILCGTVTGCANKAWLSLSPANAPAAATSATAALVAIATKRCHNAGGQS